jgi:hypothetical protein
VSEPAELQGSLERTAHRTLVASVAIVAVVVVLIVVLRPWKQAASGSGLGWLPVVAGILATVILLRMHTAARRAANIIDGPRSTLFLTTERYHGFRRGYMAHLRLRPDDDPVADLAVVYNKPPQYLLLSNVEATVYGSLEPGTPAVAVTGTRATLIGRIRR